MSVESDIDALFHLARLNADLWNRNTRNPIAIEMSRLLDAKTPDSKTPESRALILDSALINAIAKRAQNKVIKYDSDKHFADYLAPVYMDLADAGKDIVADYTRDKLADAVLKILSIANLYRLDIGTAIVNRSNL